MNHNTFEFIPSHGLIVDNALSVNLCDKIIHQTEKEHDYRVCSYNGKVDLHYRDCLEIKVKDRNMINEIWSKIKTYVPANYNDCELVGPHYSKVYLLKYGKDQHFKKHYDGYSVSSKGHQSKVTVMIYLHDIPEKCGGATRFYAEPDRNIYFNQPHNNDSYYDIIPKVGKMVLFTHKILHEGMPILEGYKYCLRLNVLYTDNPGNSNDIDKQIELPKEITPYKFPSKNRKTESAEWNNYYETMKHYTNPNPNGLKYRKTKMVCNGKTVILTNSLVNKDSRRRWEDVSLRDHVFEIERKDFVGFIDTSMGRPPTWKEDYCPNCYEILPIDRNYSNCSGCIQPVIAVDEVAREFRMNHP